MIDPRDFVGGKKEQEIQKEDEVTVGGNFICGECFANVNSASLDEDNMVLKYVCPEGHINKATI